MKTRRRCMYERYTADGGSLDARGVARQPAPPPRLTSRVQVARGRREGAAGTACVCAGQRAPGRARGCCTCCGKWRRTRAMAQIRRHGSPCSAPRRSKTSGAGASMYATRRVGERRRGKRQGWRVGREGKKRFRSPPLPRRSGARRGAGLAPADSLGPTRRCERVGARGATAAPTEGAQNVSQAGPDCPKGHLEGARVEAPRAALRAAQSWSFCVFPDDLFGRKHG